MATESLPPATQALWEAAVREDVPDAHATALRAAEEHTALIANAWSAVQVAQHLNTSTVAVRRSVQDGQLAGFTHQMRLLFPCWQLTKRGVLPGLAEVLKHLPDGLPAVAVEGFFTNSATIDLFIDGVRVSPRDWLSAGKRFRRHHPLRRGLEGWPLISEYVFVWSVFMPLCRYVFVFPAEGSERRRKEDSLRRLVET